MTLDRVGGTYSGGSLEAALAKAAEELKVPVADLEHETLLGGDATGHVLIRARVREASSPILSFVERLLAALDCRAPAKARWSAAALEIQLVGPDAARLVEGDDERLAPALHHLVSKVGEKLEPGRKVTLEILEAEEDRDQLLAQIAEVAIDRCRRYGRAVALPPMNPYERRLVHMSVREHSELSTESSGVGRDRRIVVVPYAADSSAGSSDASQPARGDVEDRGGEHDHG